MEGTTVTPAGERAIDAATMIEAFHRTARAHPEIVAVRTRDDEVSITWGELRERADALAGGLAKLGVGRGDTVALMFGNAPEFHLSDLAVMTLGATPFSIYQTYTSEQIRYLVSDAGARVAIIQPQFVANVLEARGELPDLEHVVVAGGEAPNARSSRRPDNHVSNAGSRTDHVRDLRGIRRTRECEEDGHGVPRRDEHRTAHLVRGIATSAGGNLSARPIFGLSPIRPGS